MKRFLLAAIALSLSACVTAGPVGSTTPTSVLAPVTYADRTAVDEQVGVGIELGYKAFRTALELGVDTGVIKGANAVRAKAADATAYRAVQVFRQAYDTANASDLLLAARSANIAIAQALATIKGK